MTTAAVYEGFVAEFVRGGIDWEANELKVMLVSGDYEPDQWKDESAAAIRRRWETPAAGDYQAGGQLLEDRSITGAFPDPIRLEAGSVHWDDFTGSFRYAVIYRTSDDLLVGYTDVGPQALKNATLTIEYGSDGGVCEFSIVPASAEQ